MIETIRAFKSTEPYTHLKEFRPLGLEDWSEKIEGDTKVNIKVDEKTGQDLISKYAGPFSQIVSLQNSDPIRHDRDTPAYTNHVTNPSYEGYSGAVDVRENLARNPRPATTHLLLGDWTFEPGWYGLGGLGQVHIRNEATPSGTSTYIRKLWTNNVPDAGAGAVFQLTAGNSGFTQVSTSQLVPIKSGETLTISVDIRLSKNYGDEDFYISYAFFDEGGVRLAGEQAGPPKKAGIEWTRLHATLTAPAGATYVGARLRGQLTDVRAGDYIDAHGLLVEKTDTPLPYFDGSTRGEFGTEVSRRNLIKNPTFRSGNTSNWDRNNLGLHDTSFSSDGGPANQPYFRIKADAGVTLGFGTGLYALGVFNSEIGETVTTSAYLRSNKPIEVRVGIETGATPIVRQAVPAGQWTRVSNTQTTTTAGNKTVIVYVGSTSEPGTQLDISSILVEKSDRALRYFDGSVNPNPASHYRPEWTGTPDASESVLRAGSADLTPRWTGTPNNSPSALAGTLPANTQVGNNDAVIAWESTVNPRNGPTHVRAMARNNVDTASIYFYGTEGISAGEEISTGISIRPQYPVTFYIRGPKTENGMDLFQEDIEPGNDYTEYKVQGIASEYTTGDPGGATLEFSNVGIGHDWEAGTYIDFDNYFVYKGITDHPYKDGDTTGWYWNGQRHASTSSSYERLAVENYIYDSYYVQKITPDIRGRTYTLECVGIKEYLDYRLAIPAGMNPANGVITIPDGSTEEKPIPANQRLYLGSRTYKGIIKGLIDETSKLEELPLEISNEFTSGTRERNYLLKDLRTIKEAIDNIIGNQEGPDVIFDGGFGDASQPKFFMTADTPIRRGEIIELSSRKSEIFRPDVEVNQNEYVNNLWVAGNASDGNMILAHKTVPVGAGPLLQRANTQRSDISTSAFLLDYTLGIIEMAGTEIRAMRLKATNTKKFFQARPGYIFYLKAPEDPTIHNTLWKIVEREIRREQIVFDLVEVTL